MKRLLVLFVLAIAPAFAANCLLDVRTDCFEQSEQQNAERVLHKYQKLLGLDDWKITLHLDTVQHIKALAGREALACSTREGETLEIWVMKLSEYTPAFKAHLQIDPTIPEFAETDQRNSIVHELVHQVWQLTEEENGVQLLTGAINP